MSHPGLAGGPIYLDYNATTPVDPRVLAAAVPYLATHFGNPSSGHRYADEPRAAVLHARNQVAGLLGARQEEIVFTSGGSESDALAIRGAALAQRNRGNHVITQRTEHPAVLETCAGLAADGYKLTVLPVDEYGRVDPDGLREALTDRTALVTIMHGNGETGTIQPLAELARLAHRAGALVHTDAAQTVGKIPVDVTEIGVDLLTLVGHKMYAPKGIGALYVRAGVEPQPMIMGGGQERGLRAGTENVGLIAALGAAAQLAAEELPGGLHAARPAAPTARLVAARTGRAQRATHRADARHAQHQHRRGPWSRPARRGARDRRVHRLGLP